MAKEHNYILVILMGIMLVTTSCNGNDEPLPPCPYGIMDIIDSQKQQLVDAYAKKKGGAVSAGKKVLDALKDPSELITCVDSRCIDKKCAEKEIVRARNNWIWKWVDKMFAFGWFHFALMFFGVIVIGRIWRVREHEMTVLGFPPFNIFKLLVTVYILVSFARCDTCMGPIHVGGGGEPPKEATEITGPISSISGWVLAVIIGLAFVWPLVKMVIQRARSVDDEDLEPEEELDDEDLDDYEDEE